MDHIEAPNEPQKLCKILWMPKKWREIIKINRKGRKNFKRYDIKLFLVFKVSSFSKAQKVHKARKVSS